MPCIESTPEFVAAAYDLMRKRLEIVRQRIGRPLTLAQKIILGHLARPELAELEAGVSYVELRPDRVAMQDATAQMALLQFMQAGRPAVAVPTTVHCDHLIQARAGAGPDTDRARSENAEVYDFLASVSAKYGIGFWKPGSGIIHQVVLENYAFPGGLMIGTDSHTPNAGGLGMCAAGVGGADAVDVMAGFPWEVLLPKTIGVRLLGRLEGWSAPKDVILKLCGMLTVKGGTNKIVEYFGPGTSSISCTGKGTICNMGAELGATCSVFPFDDRMAIYLRATGRAALADLAARSLDLVTADAETAEKPELYYDEIVEIDLCTLEPHLVGPHTPDLARPLSQVAAAARTEAYPQRVTAALIGSCTNSSYEDISRVAAIAEEAAAHGYAAKASLLISPGSDMIHAAIARDGQMAALEKVGAQVLANACGPCIGQWKREDVRKGDPNSIVTSFNRNFPGRNDSNPDTLAFIASPEVTLALGLAGSLSFNPLTDMLEANGRSFRLSPPPQAPEVPVGGFERVMTGYQPPSADPETVVVKVRSDSERLSLLDPFPPAVEAQFLRMPLLLKTRGKTTTDHISPAGPWLRYRGHLDRISDNMFTGAIRAGTGERGMTRNPLTGEQGQPVPAVARALKAAGRRWVVVGDENYGEGSSREHAAMSPRHLGCAVVLTRSFARIHESNLKKQGILPLTFSNPADYDRVREDDELSIPAAFTIAPGKPLLMLLHHRDGSEDRIEVRHSCNAEQIGWIQAGGALNLLRAPAA
ncbi:MAG TPA: aconitate hydratase [Candidatus Limnocylindrales bacterium]|nr:aconitate hydratase [Candidatus Limnocylindrales bacterium]